jgi:preprotein translocase subunit SecE
VAERNRRGDDAADDRVDDVFDDAIDDDAIDDALDEGEDVAEAEGKKRKGGGAALKTKVKPDQERRVGIFGRIGRFFREVVAELRKVIWPTRNELLTYTAVVVVFVAVMTALVMGLDYVYAKGVLFVFGNPKQ